RAGDVNGDGYADIIIGSPYNSNKGKIYLYYGGPGLNNSYDAAVSGGTAGDWFGVSAACAGDVNGDGLSDFIVGANGNDAAANNAGAAYLFFGRTSINYSSSLTLTGTGAGDAFGSVVSSAGDVNGDGYSDVLVSAFLNDAGGVDAGRVYCYFGGASMNNVVDVTFTGQAGSDEFGRGINSAGDVNGDGYSDIIIGAPNNDGGATNAGRVYIYYGGSSVDNTADKTITSIYANTNFGYSVAGIGDVNGDAFDDVIVGIPQSNRTAANYGAADVYFGGINMDIYPDILLNGNETNSGFGYSVSTAGDLNGDGYFDFLVGAPYNNGNAIGKVFIYKNSLTGEDIADWKFTSYENDNSIGVNVTSAGDVNGDGFSDFMIRSEVSVSGGRVFLFMGGASPDNVPDAIFNSTNINYGYSIANAGDVNGDGYSDIMIGDERYTSSTFGRVCIYFGGINFDTTADVRINGTLEYAGFGRAVCSGGDINNDGFSDVLIGAPAENDTGTVYVYLGGINMNNVFDYKLIGKEEYEKFGDPIASAGDLNNDGYSDLIIGATNNSQNGTLSGRVYIYFGGSDMDTICDAYFGGRAVDRFGSALSGLGDINGDGYSDIIVGAKTNSLVGQFAGRALIYFGGIKMDSNNVFIINGESTFNYFGQSVSTAGDINKDGYKDFIIGASQTDFNGINSGRAYIYFGGQTLSNNAQITLTGSPNENLGYVVSTAGDVNGDGFEDIICGAPGSSNNKGAAYLNLNSSPATVPRLISVSDVPNDQGGNVRVKFTRSGYDASGQNRITGYYIEKSPPPGVSGYAWEPVTTIAPTHNPIYSFTASTWGDSSSNGSDRIYFRITAQTSNGSEYWRSNIVYGQSIDNLSPASPTGLAAAPTSVKINLSWTANTEQDMKDYLVYRNGVNISSAGSISFSDTTALADSVYIYKIAARDIHGNISPLSTADTASLESITTINVTVIPEGLLNTGTNQLRMRDTIKAKLWDLTGSVIVDSATAVIDSITFIASFTFKNAPSGDYYLAIVHRNSIETWSKTGGENYTRGTTTTYDFTSANTQAYGNNLKLKGGRYCLYSGDVNGSGVINSTDRTLIRSNVGQTGYIRFDLDGNGVVNSADRTIVRNNTGIAKQRP
ncbi:MAG: FG-GAP repeat protein, partial [Ignavibacteria bacterium]|nr:FG-GAP repeat protein [Ignavibacteria bacterium]